MDDINQFTESGFDSLCLIRSSVKYGRVDEDKDEMKSDTSSTLKSRCLNLVILLLVAKIAMTLIVLMTKN